MEKSVKWQDTSQQSEMDSSDSPTLSDEKMAAPLKRKKSNIFSKIRKSLLGIGSSDKNTLEDDDQQSLKRALSMDAGLQNRISLLSSNIPENTEDNQHEIQRTTRKNRMRRSKSLMSAINDFIEPTNLASGIGSIMQSPKVPESSTNDSNDSILEAFESFNTPKTESLINTIETSSLNLTHQIFNCSWLAPTRKSQLFPGTLSILPKSSTIQFHCQHFNRTIRLKFSFDDILNISRGSWNDKRNQALIIDLIRGKRKSWVFVAWTDDHFRQASDCLVEAWKHHCINQIKLRLDRRRAHLNMKYCRIIKEADKANETSKSPDFGLFDNVINFWKSESVDTKTYNRITVKLKEQGHNNEFKNVLYESQIPFIIPQILSSILMEKSTNFMTNFRALHGIVITNDSGWNYEKDCRFFVSYVTKEEANKKTFKWKVKQEIKLNEPEIVVFETILQVADNQIYKINYEIKSNIDDIEKFTCDYSSFIKVTGEIESSDPTFQLNSEKEICSYFSKTYFPALFHLLKALINESQSEFEAETATESANFVLPPHYRFVKESIRTRVLETNLYFTTVLLPFLYKLLYFKEFKYLRFLFLSFLFIYLFKISLNSALTFIKITKNQPINVKGQFEGFLKDLAIDAIDSGSTIHSLKLKYQQQ